MRHCLVLALIATACLTLLSNAHGQDDLVGKKAPNFKAGEMINGTGSKTLDDCRGEVILIKYWGTR